MDTISRQQLQSKIKHNDNFYLVEALPEQAYDEAHLPGAINISAQYVHDLAPKFIHDKNAEIVTYCAKST